MKNEILPILAIIFLLIMAGYAFHRERCRSGLFLGVALALTALLEMFDLLALTATDNAISWKWYALIAESLLPPFWILASLRFARQSGPWKMGEVLRAVVAFTFLFFILPFQFPLDSFLYAPDFPVERLLFLGNVGYFYYVGIMACLVFALVNFESTLANASPDAIYKIKYEIIGLGTILAVQIFYYSQALLYRSLNMNYVALRSFLYLVALALMAYSLLMRSGNVRIQVSRQVAFKSVVLVAVGFYLVMLGLFGEGMQYFSTSFQRTVTISFSFLVGIFLLILFLSERFRREVKVVLHKNFYQHKHDYRTQWLRFTKQLSTSRTGEELLQRILAAYCDIFGINGAVLFLFEKNQGGYCMAAEHDMKPIEDVISPENSLVKFMKERGWVVSVKDENPEIMEQNARFFRNNLISFVIPLFAGEMLEGFIFLGRAIKDDEVYIYEDYDLMKTIARQASQAILHQRLSEHMLQSREMEAVGNIAAFVAHDLKNLVSNLSLIVENAARHMHNPDFQKDMLISLGNTVDKMQQLISRLKNLGEPEHSKPKPLNLLDLVEQTVGMISGSSISVSGTPEYVCADENDMQNVIMNLLRNAIEASGPNEPVQVEVGSKGVPYVSVTDQGCGMSARFIRTELFKPFKTTKKKGLGIGLYQCRQTLESFGGRIEVNSEEGKGAKFTIWFGAQDDSVTGC
jgi:putative PEP-CTERM system histidine kinase